MRRDSVKKYDLPTLNKKDIRRLNENGYDLGLIARTQPQGNVIPHERYIEYGDGYAAILTLYSYPSHDLGDYWLRYLMSNDNTIGIVSLGTENKEEILQSLKKSVDEKASQISDKNRTSDNLDAQDDYLDDVNVLRELRTTNSQMKRLYVRVLVYADTRAKLDERIHKIKESSGEFGMTAFLGEQEEEWHSTLMPTMQQEHLKFHRKGVPADLSTVGGMYYFDHTKLEDEKGSYYGFTSTGGAINFDLWKRDNQRTRSFMFVTGQPGMGKSTFLKMNTMDAFARGHYIRNFDISNEYAGLTEYLGGETIDLASSENKINPFEIFATDTDASGEQVDQINSFNNHINKLKTIFLTMNAAATADDMLVLDQLLVSFYIDYCHMWSHNPDRDRNKLKVTGLPHNQYPLLSDWNTYLGQIKRAASQEQRSPTERQSIDRIRMTFVTMQEKEGNIFEGFTNIPDFEKESFVTFNTGSLKSHGQATYNAQLHSVLSLVSSHIVNNGKYWRKQVSDGNATDDDVQKYLLNLDEAEEIITPKFPEGADLLAATMEQMRKNYCGIALAAPTIKGIVMNNSDSEKDTPYMSAVKKIFSLCQFRGFFQLPTEDIDLLSTALKGSITKEELEAITKLSKRHIFLNINGVTNLTFEVQTTNDMISLFGGGQG